MATRFLTGGEEYVLAVEYITSDGVARNREGVCAFCEGDPCAESPYAPERIVTYMAQPYAECCPFCQGRS